MDEELLKLDLGCGIHKRDGFVGVDIQKFEGVDQVVDLTKPWPWADGSVWEVNCTNTVEHFTWPERVHFFNELYRVLRTGGTANIVTPAWNNARFYGDPTHKEPMSEWYALYLNAAWRKDNAPHTDYVCDFEFTSGGSWDEWLNDRNVEFRTFAMSHYTNAWRDLMITLTKK